MNVNGTKEFEASREVVWSVIDDPAQMAGLMPGVQEFEITDERHWQAKVKVPLGLGGLKMTIDFEKLEERPPEFASMNAKGKGVGALMNMTTSFTLSGEGDHTSMAWEADVKIAGPVVGGVVVFHWTMVLTLGIGCVIVIVMKGPGYVADGYMVSHSDKPRACAETDEEAALARRSHASVSPSPQERIE